MVLVLPWHDPLRVVEGVVVLDHVAQGKFTLGLGRGLSEAESEGLRVPVSESLSRFEEVADIVISAMASGRVEQRSGNYHDLPAREIRPAPFQSLTGRIYGAPSVASVDMMARLGSGLLLVPRTSLDENVALVADHADAWARAWPESPVPRPILNQFICIHPDADLARESAHRHLEAFHRENQRHHATTSLPPNTQPGTDSQLADFIARAAWGTPDQVMEKLAVDARRLHPSAILTHASYGGMPREDAERSIRLFTGQVMPALKADASIGETRRLIGPHRRRRRWPRPADGGNR